MGPPTTLRVRTECAAIRRNQQLWTRRGSRHHGGAAGARGRTAASADGRSVGPGCLATISCRAARAGRAIEVPAAWSARRRAARGRQRQFLIVSTIASSTMAPTSCGSGTRCSVVERIGACRCERWRRAGIGGSAARFHQLRGRRGDDPTRLCPSVASAAVRAENAPWPPETTACDWPPGGLRSQVFDTALDLVRPPRRDLGTVPAFVPRVGLGIQLIQHLLRGRQGRVRLLGERNSWYARDLLPAW